MAFEQCASRSVLITRPRTDALALADKLAKCKIHSVIDSMLTVRYLRVPKVINGPLPNVIHACIITSKKAVCALLQYNVPFDTPIFVVALTTARQVQQQGYRNVIVGGGYAASLIPLIIKQMTKDENIVYFCGHDTRFDFIPALLHFKFNIIKVIIYMTDPASILHENTILLLKHQQISTVLFYSPKTVRTFCKLANKIDLNIDKVIAICLSPVIAQTVSLPFAKTIAAGAPNDDMMIQTLQNEVFHG